MRKHLRFHVDGASAKLYVKGFLTTLGLGRVNKARAAVNLSEGGVLLLAGESLAAGTQVQVRVDMEKYDDVIETSGVVRWCFQSARNDREFYVGIMFTGLDPKDQKRIAKMRDWFLSPEYRTRTTTRRRLRAQQGDPPG
jgi:hypothetical protein